ncbi:MAG: hypothetical protein CMH98_10980 [Oceanospirillaceae bacterium]|nr:hypothetical protein [Oceanospirillaceae bacterium]
MSRNIDIVVLRSFISVVSNGGVSKAANALHVTQSAISQHIKRLESMLNTSLFIRSGRNVTLTPAGEELLEYASKILATNDEIISRFSQSVEKTSISIGLSEHISHVYLPKILANTAQSSHIEIDAKIALNQELYSDINNGLLDMALLISEQGIHQQKPVSQYQLSWVSSPELNPDEFPKYLPIVVYGGPCLFRTMMISTLESHNIPWKVVYSASSIGDLKAALAAKMGVSALLECEIDSSLQLNHPIFQPLPDLPMVDVLLHSKSSHTTAEASRLAVLIQQALYK